MQAFAQIWNCQCILVRQACPLDRATHFAELLATDLSMIEQECGSRAVTVGNKKMKRYRTIQGTDRGCTCTYGYEGTTRHPLLQMEKLESMREATFWLHDELGYPWGRTWEYAFNQIVANSYDHELQQIIDWHSDADGLYASNTVTASLTLDSPGVLCIMPRENSPATQKRSSKYADRTQHYIQEGLRCLVPLLPGDLLFAAGEFQTFLQHKTLSRVQMQGPIDHLRLRYPGTPNFFWDILNSAVFQEGARGARKRSVMTWHRVVNHVSFCRLHVPRSGLSFAWPPPPSAPPPQPPQAGTPGATPKASPSVTPSGDAMDHATPATQGHVAVWREEDDDGDDDSNDDDESMTSVVTHRQQGGDIHAGVDLRVRMIQQRIGHSSEKTRQMNILALFFTLAL